MTMKMPTPMDRCDFGRDGNEWVCRGNGNMLGEVIFGRGKTRKGAYDKYVSNRRRELADLIDADADEAEMVQAEHDDEPGADRAIGTSLRDALMHSADVAAMREKARRLRGE